MASPGPGSSGRLWEKGLVLGLVIYACIVAVVLLCPRRCDLRAWLKKLRYCRRSPKLTKEEVARERRIRDECEMRRVERARGFIVASNVLNLLMGALVFMNIGMNSINPAQTLIINAGQFGRTTMALLASRLTSRALDGFFCFCILVIAAVKVAHGPSVEITERERAVVLFQLLYWSLASLKPWLNALGFLCVAIVETMMIGMAGSPWVALHGWFIYSFGAAWIFGLDYCLRRSVRMEILAADSENELDAIRTLLDSICDVILQLDSRLRLKNHSPKLAHLLFLHAPGRTLEGEDLRAHMATERDSVIFGDRLQGSQVAPAHATVFHAKMRDSTRTVLDMEFFSVGFRGRDGNQHHILGMREYTDIRPVLRPPQLPPPAPRVPDVPPAQAGVPVALTALPPHLPPGHPQGPAGSGATDDLELGGAGGRASSSSLGPSSDSGDSAVEVVGAPPVPLAQPQPPASGLPLQLVPAPALRERGERRTGLGTPASLERTDIGSHGSAPPGAPRSDNSDRALISAGSGDGPPPPPPVVVETAAFARELSVNFLLCSWSLRVHPGACCPKHTALLRLESLVTKMKAKPCVKDFGPITEWQCPRCGIMSDEYQDPRHRRKCFLCKQTRDAALHRCGDEGGGDSRMAI